MLDCIDHGKRGSIGGYAQVKVKGVAVYMHRLAYCFTRQIPMEYIKGVVIRHTCDNPRCINPRHLLVGTHQDNVDDRQARGRQVRGAAVHTSRLSDADVLAIRATYVPRCKLFGGVALALKYNVAPSQISRIVNGFTWKE